MAEFAVTFLVERLATLVEEEIRMLSGVRNEIKNIKDEFQSIKALLKYADSMVDIDVVAAQWVAQVRGVAYEIEDVLDKYFLKHSLGVPKRPGSSVGSINNIFGKIRGFFKCMKSQHEIGNELIDIKGRILEISSRKERYQVSNLDVASSSTARTIVKRDPREDALYVDESNLVGTEGRREKLIRRILEANAKLSVFPVLGEGGLGKTTIVKKVFDSPSVKGEFAYRAWLTISQTPDTEKLLTTLFKQLFPTLSAEDSINLKQQINDNLRGKRYIVVLDDIWTVDAWKELKNALPDDKESGSRILVTTRNLEVANTCVQASGRVYPLECLSPDDSWKLFYMKACSSRTDGMNSYLEDDGMNSYLEDDGMNSYLEDFLRAKSEKFLKKCCGLPLAIVAMGGLLSTKQLTEWDKVYRTLGSLPLKDLNLVISLSFNDLPYYLKSCFLYLCMLPEDYAIKCSRLIRLWVAIGFVEKQGSEVSMEETAKSYLDELIQRSLIQVDRMDERKRVVSCKIHDVMRDFIVGKARDQNFALVISRKQDEQQFWAGDGGTKMVQQPRHLSICTSEGDDDDENNILFRNNNRVVVDSRSLLVFPSSRYAVNMFLSFRLLKVLDLESANIMEEFPEEIVNMFYLRYLSLKGNRRLKSLPNTVGKLVNLETLDIKNTSIKELPIPILKLKRLRNLLMGVFDDFVMGTFIYFMNSFGTNLPVGIGCLINLEKLVIGRGNEDVIKELGMLTRLRKLSILGLKADAGKKLFSSIQRMNYLNSLKVSFDDGELVDTQSLWSPPPFLQSLYIDGILNELPPWFALLQNLEKLQLLNSKLVDDPFQVLQELPSLVILELHHYAFMGKELRINKHGFPRLIKLFLSRAQNLHNMDVEEEAMPVIQTIVFEYCKNLEYIPYGIKCLRTLQTFLGRAMAHTFTDDLWDFQKQLLWEGIDLTVHETRYIF